jgi:hypothetical protein
MGKIAIREVGLGEIQPADLDTESAEADVLNEPERQHLLSESAKLRAAARKQYKTYCREESCGKEIVGLSRKKFCSQNCQRRHWRRRLAAMSPGDVLPSVE